MKLLSVFRCIGLIFIWFIVTSTFSLVFRNTNAMYFGLISNLLFGIIAFAVNWKTHYISFAPRGNTESGRSLLQLILAVAAGIGASFFGAVVLVQAILSGRLYSLNFEIGNYWLFFAISVLSAVMVEVFFRGILMNILRPYFRPVFVILIPSVLFLFMAGIPEQMLGSLVTGLLLGYFYYYTRNIYAVIILRLVYNLMWTTFLNGVIFSNISSRISVMNAALIFSTAGFIIMTAVVLIFYKLIVKNHKNDDMEKTLNILRHAK